MDNLMDLLQGQLTDGLIDQLSQQIGAPRQQTRTATDSILSTIIGGLAKNASQPGGADALANALDNDHDGSLLDSLNDVLAGNQPTNVNSRTMNGAGILKHILGGKQGNAIDMISEISGLNSGKTGNLMATLAPIVMGMLGRQKQQQGLDSGGLASILAQTMGTQKQRGGLATTLISNLLDRDGDGSAVDDVARIGMNIFSKFFKK